MYRTAEPAFCRACGTRWTSGAASCEQCGEARELAATGIDHRPLYRAQGRRLLVLAGSIVGLVAILAVRIVGELEVLALVHAIVDGVEPLPGVAEAFESRLQAIELVYLIALVATAVGFCTWLFDATRNLRALGETGLRYPEERQVLWYFVPVANVFVPLLGMHELWERTAPASGMGRRVLLGLWWATWLGSLGLLLASRILPDSEAAEDFVPVLSMSIVGAGLRIVAAVLLLCIVVAIQRQQDRRAASDPLVRRAS